MKNLKVLLGVLSAGMILSCSNDFDFTADPEDIPVAFVIIDPDEERHYVRLERVFVDDDIPASELAQDPDRLYYQNANVSILNDSTEERLVFQRVVGDDIGLPRDTGFFASSPNVLYEAIGSGFFSPKDQLLLEINTGESANLSTSRIRIVPLVELRQPDPGETLSFDSDEGELTSIRFRQELGDELRRVFEVKLFIDIREQVSSGQFENRILEWDLGLVSSDQNTTNVLIPGRDFYLLLADRLDPVPSVLSRSFEDITIEVTALGPEYLDATALQNANTGLTSSQEIPVFTNINGGLGLFSSVSVLRESVSLDLGTVLDVRNNELTENLGF